MVKIYSRAPVRRAFYEVFQGWTRTGRWYWHLKSSNGKIIANGGQGYASEWNTLRAIEAVKRESILAKVRVKE